MTHAIPLLKLATGASIPQYGFGTYLVAPEDTQRLVETALEMGIRHIDTAQMYGNEKEVGQALAHCDRDSVFLTTKLNNSNHRRVKESFAKSLEDLGVEAVDLFLIHWPMPDSYDGDYVSTWQAMCELEGARAVGVSNFQPDHLQKIIDETGIIPAVNQIEAHPEFANNAVRAFNAQHGIITEAWSPLGRARYLHHPVLLRLAHAYGKTPAQILLRWAIQRGDVVFPKASSPERIAENLAIFDWKLDQDACQSLDAMDRGEAGRQGSHPDTMNVIPSEK